ncbi:MAG: pseudouridylate synthase [Bacteroidota bacterium]
MNNISDPGNSSFFIPFAKQPDKYALPRKFRLMLHSIPHPLCALAAEQLQEYLLTQQEWKHNFGLTADGTGPVIGKMFGVLVVQTPAGEVGYLCGFSGKLAGANLHTKFVPPVFDTLAEDGFLAPGMKELSRMSESIKMLQTEQPDGFEAQIKQLKTSRRNYSNALQRQLFDHYFCVNRQGEHKSVQAIFETADYKNPPAGAAECATPKLLQYAFLNQLKPLAVAEFWWGQSPKSDYWKHEHFYPCCKEKCEPILAHMLSGMEYEYL